MKLKKVRPEGNHRPVVMWATLGIVSIFALPRPLRAAPCTPITDMPGEAKAMMSFITQLSELRALGQCSVSSSQYSCDEYGATVEFHISVESGAEIGTGNLTVLYPNADPSNVITMFYSGYQSSIDVSSDHVTFMTESDWLVDDETQKFSLSPKGKITNFEQDIYTESLFGLIKHYVSSVSCM